MFDMMNAAGRYVTFNISFFSEKYENCYSIFGLYCTERVSFCWINSRYSNNTVSEHLLNSSSVTSNSILVMSLYLTAFYFSRQTIIRKSTVCISAKVKKKKSAEKQYCVLMTESLLDKIWSHKQIQIKTVSFYRKWSRE